jgi:VIT1/CCC1 family predicted Fe2+/Mn2+ transporter
MKLEVAAPAGLADVIAAFIADGALVVSTRAISAGDQELVARTVVHLDGDVTIKITAACLSHPGRGELLARHDRELRRIGGILRRAGAWGATAIALAGTAGAAIAAVTDLVSGHSWLHAAVALGGTGAATSAAAWLAARISRWFVVRKVRRMLRPTQPASAARPPAPPPGAPR